MRGIGGKIGGFAETGDGSRVLPSSGARGGIGSKESSGEGSGPSWYRLDEATC